MKDLSLFPDENPKKQEERSALSSSPLQAKFKKTRRKSALTTISAEDEMRRVNGMWELNKVMCDKPTAGRSIHILTGGNIDLLSRLLWLLQFWPKVRRVFLSAWAISAVDILMCKRYLEEGTIGTLELLLGDIFPSKYKKEWEKLMEMYDAGVITNIYTSANIHDRMESEGTELARNQLAVSIRQLAEKWIWTISKVRRFLLALEQKGYVMVCASSAKTIITIIDFGEGSTVCSDSVATKPSETPTDTPSETLSETPTDTLQNHENTDAQRGLSRIGETLTDTPADTPSETPTDTPTDTLSRAYKNDNIISCLNEEKKKEDIIDSSLRSESLSTHVDPRPSTSPEDVVEFYNKTVKGTALSRCVKLTDKRRKAITARVRQFGAGMVFKAIKDAAASDFLNGANNRNWTADFDFVFNQNKMANILEGKYSNHATTKINQGHRNSDHPSDSELREQSVRLMQRLSAERHARQAEIRQGAGFPHEDES